MSSLRLRELDALRGIAAMSVALFHYGTRFTQLFGGPPIPTLAFPHGHLGVNLFFILSGFVIFMTLDNMRSATDFIVGRFSRLFPTYWAAVVLTFGVTAVLGLPGRTVSALQALANAPMLHGLLGIPHVDGVYWTLEVELLFYALMLGSTAVARGHRWGVCALCLALLATQWGTGYGLHLPPMLRRLLILDQLPWFVLGIAAYLLHIRPRDIASRIWAAALTTAALCGLWEAGGAFQAAWAGGLMLLVWAAISGHLPWLQAAPLVWLGTVSYPFYLVHQNIGYSLLLRARQLQLDQDVSIVLIIGCCLVLAGALNQTVERPAMAVIRSRWSRANERLPH